MSCARTPESQDEPSGAPPGAGAERRLLNFSLNRIKVFFLFFFLFPPLCLRSTYPLRKKKKKKRAKDLHKYYLLKGNKLRSFFFFLKNVAQLSLFC